MPISDRIEGSVEKWTVKWADRLKDWVSGVIAWGLELIMDAIGKGMGKRLDTIIDALADEQGWPDEQRERVKETWRGEGEWQAMLGSAAGGTAVGGLISSTIGPWLKLLEYKGLGVAKPFRLDPISIITAWRRDPAAYESLWQDLRDQGWNDDRIEALKFVTLFYPGPGDLVRWQAREVFEPEMIERYGLDSEFAAIDKEPFYKAGMTDEQILNYWRAHWEHASWMQVVEMLHRGLLTEEQVWDWFRVVEIPPFWRQMLIQTAYTWPTRVDVRRWWDMRTIDETELRRLYSGMGYRGVNLDNYVLWTKVYVAFPDLMARWTKGWITIDQVRSELTGLGMPAERVEEMIQMKVKPEEPERVEEGKALTKTEIYKGVKKGVITWEEGIELLMDLNYDYEEADYILTINVGVLEGSPETFAEFKDITQKYKIATSQEEKPMPEELKAAAEEVIRVTKELEALEESIKEEEAKLLELEPRPEEAEARLKGLQLARNRAIAELSRVKLEYDRQLAEWRYGTAK